MALAEEVVLAPQAQRDALVAVAHGGARVVEVDDLGVREEADALARVADPLAPLHVLAVHEEALVETAGPLEHGAGQQHEGPDDPVDVALLGVIPVAAEERGARSAPAEQLVEPEVLEEREPQRREAVGRVLETSVPKAQPALSEPDVRRPPQLSRTGAPPSRRRAACRC